LGISAGAPYPIGHAHNEPITTGTQHTLARVGRFFATVPRPVSTAHKLGCYLTGSLTDHPHKHCDTLAAMVPGTSEQQLQGLLTMMQRWRR
jgi:hypothetical protein